MGEELIKARGQDHRVFGAPMTSQECFPRQPRLDGLEAFGGIKP